MQQTTPKGNSQEALSTLDKLQKSKKEQKTITNKKCFNKNKINKIKRETKINKPKPKQQQQIQQKTQNRSI